MIDKLLGAVTKKLEQVKPLYAPYHVGKEVVVPLEEELLRSNSYEAGKPEGHVPGIFERRYQKRMLVNPVNGAYLGMQLCVGCTTLHIKDAETKLNMEAVLLVQLGMAAKLRGAAGVALLSNGAVSAVFGVPLSFTYTSSWYPEGKAGLGSFPYPNSGSDVLDLMKREVMATNPRFDAKAARGLPDLVMLAVNTYKRFDKE
ncbi:hypothetical protein HYY73_05310 [Candidatus Woesearchaeota archaeon]|nr:hypothetical protein [Candidatus Woesearchaeota archaeon]